MTLKTAWEKYKQLVKKLLKWGDEPEVPRAIHAWLLIHFINLTFLIGSSFALILICTLGIACTTTAISTLYSPVRWISIALVALIVYGTYHRIRIGLYAGVAYIPVVIVTIFRQFIYNVTPSSTIVTGLYAMFWVGFGYVALYRHREYYGFTIKMKKKK